MQTVSLLNVKKIKVLTCFSENAQGEKKTDPHERINYANNHQNHEHKL